jgi:polar amino acid transport system ATP-binding protein
MAPVQVLGQPRDEVEARAHELLKRCGYRQGEQLSGRAVRRTAARAIARARSMRLSVMLCPTKSPPRPTRDEEVLVTIRQLVDEGMTSILVTQKWPSPGSPIIFLTDHGVIVERPACRVLRQSTQANSGRSSNVS